MKSNRISSSWLLFLGILLVAFNLRPSITAVGPLIPLIRDDLNLSNGWAGFLTTFPLLTFATFSLFSSQLGQKIGNAKAILLALFILLTGTILRVQGGVVWLYVGTGLTGIGIVIGNVLLIPFIKTKLPTKMGIVTASYTTGMTLFAAIASGISAPMAIDWNWGWKGSLLFWGVLVILGIIIWTPQVFNDSNKNRLAPQEPKVNVWKSRLAWQVSMFMGVQSLLFFTMISWLPDLMISRGLSAVEAGYLVSLMQIIGLIGTFLTPIYAVKFADQTGMVKLLGLLYLLGFISLFFHHLELNYFGLTLVGFSMGSSVSLAYTLIGLRTKNDATTSALSGMVQSTGYYLAALGPLLFGIAFDSFQDWNLFIYLMLICTGLFLYFGIASGKAQEI
jgi:MFS transporter, CP family, cyanate transporter